MTKKVKDAKYALRNALETLEKANTKSFTLKEIIKLVNEQGFTIGQAWASECLNDFNYRYDKHHKVWVKNTADDNGKITIEKSDYDHIIEGAEKIVQRYKTALSELEALKVKQATKNKAHSEKLKDIVTNLNMRSYCKTCSKENKCSSNNKFFNKPCDFVENASNHIVEVLNEIIQDII